MGIVIRQSPGLLIVGKYEIQIYSKFTQNITTV